MAFHLGCMRALNDRGLLERVKVLSTVSGGSVIGACWAYWDCDFVEFDKRMTSLLRKGIQSSILWSALFSIETPKIVATVIVTGGAGMLIGLARFMLQLSRLFLRSPTSFAENWLARLSSSLPIWGSLSTAFEHALRRKLFRETKLRDVRRQGLEVVINACDLRTQTAFRFGSSTSGGWRYGRIKDNNIRVAKAVAASAAFPLLLPPLIEEFVFERRGASVVERVVLTDGGVFDNLGVTVVEPGRDVSVSVNTFSISHIISANAGAGQASGDSSPFWWIERVAQSFATVHRKVQDAAYGRLHSYVVSGALKGFGMIYLGQIDKHLPNRPDDLVPREAVYRYPTDFAPISWRKIDALTRRGEQLTHAIIDRYLADL
jgi:Predicted esterase of the alpha-beta hydrolase superfamily